MIGYMWIRASCDINKLLIFLIARDNVDSLRAGGQTVSLLHLSLRKAMPTECTKISTHPSI